jgi:hypothetical protein
VTISSTSRKAGPYLGNAVATQFAFAFKVFAASDLYVIRTDATPAESLLTLGTDYSVTLNADQDVSPGGSVTLTAALPSGFLLTITSALAPLQQTDLANQGGFYPKVITTALDKLTVLVQQLANDVNRSIKVPLSENAAALQLPAAAQRANTVLAFDAEGDPVPAAMVGTAESASVAWVQSELNSRSQWLRATGVDQTAQVLAAIAAGGNVQFAPGNTASNFVLSQRILLPQKNLDWTMAPGAVLDYSHPAAPWENNFLNGLIYGTGIRGTAYPIIAPVNAPRRIVPLSASIAAGVATINTVKPHGLVNNDRVHIGGQLFPAAAGTAGFFSLPHQAGADGDIPHVVTVVDTDTFTFPTTATVVPTTYSITVPHNILPLSPTDAANFQPGDIVEIDDGVVILPEDAAHHGGELNRVKWVSGGDVILSYGLKTALNPANSPVVRKVTTLKNIHIKGGEIRGRGYNPDMGPPTVYGQVGIRLGHGENCHIEGVRSVNVDQTAFELRSVINGSVSRCTVEADHRNEGGRLGTIQIQYGIAIGNACRNFRIENCHFWGLRHGIEGGGTAAYPGKFYNVVVDTCSFGGTWVSDIATHNTTGDLTVVHCHFNGRGPAMNVRSGTLIAHHNIIQGNEQALYWYYIVDEIDFRNNKCYNITGEAIFAALPMNRWPRLHIEDNRFEGCLRAVRLDPLTGGVVGDRYVTIRNNIIRDCDHQAIYLLGATDGTSQITGVIENNDIENVHLQTNGASHGIRIQNATDIVIRDNKVRAGAANNMNRGIYVDGAHTTGTRLYANEVSDSSSFDVEVATGDFTIDGESYINDVYDAPSLAAGASDIRQVTATGATAGDHLVAISHGITTDNLELSLVHFGTDFVRYRIKNVSAGVYDPPSATYRLVWRKKYK